MLIINADDFGLNRLATDNIVNSFKQGRITSTSAMVFMSDSSRAAELARECGIDVGLHLNFTQTIDQPISNELFLYYHNRIVRYLTSAKYRFLFYNHSLRREFEYVYHIQQNEYERIFGAVPTHYDGHHHMHLCVNMLVRPIIPRGQIVRRNFTYTPGDKNRFNRAYRSFVDRILERRYLLANMLFSLPEQLKFGRIPGILNLAKSCHVELQVHPEHENEFEWLNGNDGARAVSCVKKGNFLLLKKLLLSFA